MVSVKDARIIPFKSHSTQGILVPVEAERDVPFAIKRVFYITDVPAGSSRGHHAHKKCNQVLICITGSARVVCDDGQSKRSFELNSPKEGLLSPASIWGEITYLTPGTTLLVLTDMLYEESDYLRDYNQFLNWRKQP